MILKKYKIIDSYFDEEFGVSYVKINTSVGAFEGSAFLHPDDKEEYSSRFFGCQLAEIRALIKYYKALIRMKNDNIKIVKNIYNTLEQNKHFNSKYFYARQLRKQLEILKYEKFSLTRDMLTLSSKENTLPETWAKQVDANKEALKKRKERAEKVKELKKKLAENIEKNAAKQKKARIAVELSDKMDKNN